jgi:hypothetical protein
MGFSRGRIEGILEVFDTGQTLVAMICGFALRMSGLHPGKFTGYDMVVSNVYLNNTRS